MIRFKNESNRPGWHSLRGSRFFYAPARCTGSTWVRLGRPIEVVACLPRAKWI